MPRGGTITVAGKQIQLPDDVIHERVIRVNIPLIVGATPTPGPAPDVDIYVLARGKSRARVGLQTGKLRLETAPGEEHAFDFLVEALR